MTADPEPFDHRGAEPPHALIAAIGGAFVLLATLIARQGGASLQETANLLGLYAKVTEASSPEEGAILAIWGAMLIDTADAEATT